MAVENITLNLIPTGDKPSIHVAQCDVDRPFTVTLKEGEDDFTPTDYDIELQVRKVDNNIVTVVPVQISGNVVTFNTTEQMTACSGTNLAELQLTKDSQTFATLHFYLVVQRDVLAGGVTSASAIHDLEEQIAAIVPEVIGDDYYNKEEVDEKIAEIPTFDPTNYYDKSDVDTLLNNKADVSDLPDMTNYYDKSETDALLDDKADVSDLPDMSNYYNKTEVDNKITDLYQIKIVSGSIVHFTDGGDNIPMKSLESEIVAVESGSGEKSPTNPYTISGFDNGVVYVCGVNLWDEDYETGGISTSTGLPDSNANYRRSKNFIPCVPNIEVFSYSKNNAQIVLYFYDKNQSFIRFAVATQTTQTTPANCFYLKIRILSATPAPVFQIGDVSINYPSTDTQYHAYNGNTYTFTFGQTVYGGHLDNKGNLVVTHGIKTFTGASSESWSEYPSYNGFYIAITDMKVGTRQNGLTNRFVTTFDSSHTNNSCWFGINSNRLFLLECSGTTGATVADLKTWLENNNLTVIYPLANPIVLSITSQDIPTLSGENNISSNTGYIEVEYFTEKSDGIAELIKAFM